MATFDLKSDFFLINQVKFQVQPKFARNENRISSSRLDCSSGKESAAKQPRGQNGTAEKTHGKARNRFFQVIHKI